MAKNTTDWTKTSKNTTNWVKNSAFETATLLNSSSVALNSSSVTLLGYAAGTHFTDNKNITDWTTSP